MVTTIHVILDLPLPNDIDDTLWRPLLRHLMQTPDTSEPWTSDTDVVLIDLIEEDNLRTGESLTVEQQASCDLCRNLTERRSGHARRYLGYR